MLFFILLLHSASDHGRPSPDVVVLDTDALVHARFGRGKKKPRIVQAKTLPARGGHVHAVDGDAAAGERGVAGRGAAPAAQRDRASGRRSRCSSPTPGSASTSSICRRSRERRRRRDGRRALEPEAHAADSAGAAPRRVSACSRATARARRCWSLSALEATLTAIERVFAAAGFEVVLIEPVGLNIWNAIAVREGGDDGRPSVRLRARHDFTTAVFRGSQPLFIRSRNLSGERTRGAGDPPLGELPARLAARSRRSTSCYVAGERAARTSTTTLADGVQHAGARRRAARLRRRRPRRHLGLDAELTACTGVFTG